MKNVILAVITATAICISCGQNQGNRGPKLLATDVSETSSVQPKFRPYQSLGFPVPVQLLSCEVLGRPGPQSGTVGVAFGEMFLPNTGRHRVAGASEYQIIARMTKVVCDMGIDPSSIKNANIYSYIYKIKHPNPGRVKGYWQPEPISAGEKCPEEQTIFPGSASVNHAFAVLLIGNDWVRVEGDNSFRLEYNLARKACDNNIDPKAAIAFIYVGILNVVEHQRLDKDLAMVDEDEIPSMIPCDEFVVGDGGAVIGSAESFCVALYVDKTTNFGALFKTEVATHQERSLIDLRRMVCENKKVTSVNGDKLQVNCFQKL